MAKNTTMSSEWKDVEGQWKQQYNAQTLPTATVWCCFLLRVWTEQICRLKSWCSRKKEPWGISPNRYMCWYLMCWYIFMSISANFFCALTAHAAAIRQHLAAGILWLYLSQVQVQRHSSCFHGSWGSPTVTVFSVHLFDPTMSSL